MTGSKIANLSGSAGIVFSIPFWIYIGALLSLPNGRPDWMNAPVFHAGITTGFLVLGLALALFAAKLGSKWWLIGVLFSIFTLASLWYFLMTLVI